ncbi:MAG: ATP-binding response regulator, partial [Burkholderiales bacterium]
PWEEHRGFGWANALHADDRERVKALWLAAIESRTLYQSDGRFWHAPSRQWRYFTARATPLLNADGSVREWVGTCTDVEEQKRAEVERQQLLIGEQAARAEAETASRLKDEFLATVSHELRTPLHAMLGWVVMLRGKGLDAEASARALEVIERSARAQNQLITDLLEVSRIITGKLRLDVSAVELLPVIEAALDVMRPAAEARRIELSSTLDPASGLVTGDADRLQQIIWNLLSNAVKFTPKEGRIEVRLEREGTHVRVTVHDSGEGISAEFLPHVFDRFRQADGATTRAHGGLGLGLAIVRHLVELHGGTVHAGSEGKGQGSTFTVRLPLRAAGQGDKETGGHGNNPLVPLPPPSLVPLSLQGVRVLVVDDEADSRDLLGYVLRKYGAEMRGCATAAEALRMLDEWQPDVLVSDIGMPGEDGYDLMRKVRAREPERGGQVPAVALTGYARAEDERRVRAAGFQMHIPKPVELDDLAAAVASLAGRDGEVSGADSAEVA